MSDEVRIGGGNLCPPNKLLGEIAELKAHIAKLNGISMSLAADVLMEIGLDEGRTADRIRARVVKWRGQWDAIETRAALAKEGE